MKKKIIYGLLLAVSMVTASSSFVSCKDYEGDDYAHWQEQIANGTINQNSTLNDLIQFQLNTLKYELGNALGNGTGKDAEIQALLNTVNGFTYDANGSTYDLLQALNTLNGYTSQAMGYGVNTALANIRFAWGDSLKKAYDSAVHAYNLAYTDSGLIAKLKTSFDKDSAAMAAFKQKYGNDSTTFATRVNSVTKRADSLYAEAKHVADSALDVAYQVIINQYIKEINEKIQADSTYFGGNMKADSIYFIEKIKGDSTYFIGKIKGDSTHFALVTDSLKDSLKLVNVKLAAIEQGYKKADSVLAGRIDSLCTEFTKLKNTVDSLCDEVKDIKDLVKKEITGIEIQGTYNNLFGYFALPVGIQSNVLAAYYGQFDAPVSFPAGDGAESALWVGGIAKATASELPAPKNGKFTAGKGLAFDESEGNAGTLYVTVNPSNVDFTGKTFDLRSSDNKVSSFKLGTLLPSQERLMWGLTRAGANGFYEAKATLSKEDAMNASLRFDMASVKDAVKDIVNNWRNPSKIDKAALANAVYKNLQQNVARLGVQATWQDAITGQDKSYVSKYDIAAVTAKPLGFDFLYGSDFSPYVTKIQDRVSGKIHAIESEIKSMVKFNMGLDDVPSSISLTLNPSTTTLTANVYAAGTLPKEVVITNLTEFINELKNATPSISTDADKQPHLVYTYNDNTTSRDELAPGKGFGDVKRMSVDISDVRIDYEIQTSPTVSVTNYNAGDLIATANVDISGFVNDLNNSLANGSAIAGLNAMLHDVADLQSRVDTKLGEVSSMISKYLATLLRASDKAFGIIASPLKNPNRFIAPAMFATADAQTVVSLSSEEILPTQAKAGSAIALFPTSLTGELLAPAFKKYIAVTKVTGGSVTPEQINAAIKDFNTVLDGNAYNQSKPMIIPTQESWKGATVEIIYEALGYNGKVAGRKYYITFK